MDKLNDVKIVHKKIIENLKKQNIDKRRMESKITTINKKAFEEIVSLL